MAPLEYLQVVAGFALAPTDMGATVGALMSFADSGDIVVQENLHRISEFLFSDTATTLASTRALAARLRVSRFTLPAFVHRLAAATDHLERARALSIETKLVVGLPRAMLIHYVESAQYDETPLRTRVVGDRGPSGQPGSQLALPTDLLARADASSSQVALRIGQSKTLAVSASSAPQKIVQSQGELGMLVRLGEKFVALTLRMHYPLAIVESTTGAVMKHLALAQSRVGPASRAFKGITRAVTTDAASSNKSAEASIGVERQQDHMGSVLHILCEVHATAGIYSKTFRLVDSHITGIIRTALSLRTGAAMARFRACLKAEIASRMVIKTGRTTPEAMRYKQNLLHLCVTNGARATTKRALLALCPNGDWRKSEIEYFRNLEDGALSDREVILEHVTSGLVLALSSAQPSVYNRSKWTGCDIAVDELCIFEGVHALLSTTYARFCASTCTGAAAASLRALGVSLGKADCIEAPELATEDIARYIVEIPEGSNRDVESVPDAGGSSGPGDSSEVSIDAAAKANAVERRLAMSFLRERPLGILLMIRILMEPLRRYLVSQFKRASESDRHQREAIAASAMATHTQQLRMLPVVQVAEGADDVEFRARLFACADLPGLWSLTPPRFHTGKNRALAFRLISRQGCAFHKLAAARHQNYPFQTFRILVDPAISQAVVDSPACLLDKWTLGLRKKYPDMASDELKHVLYIVASLLKLDISHVESRHAPVRRMLYNKSVHTHKMEVGDLSAQWVFQQVRTHTRADDKRGHEHRPPHLLQKGKEKQKKKKRKQEKNQKRKKKAAGFGGAWRAWVRMFARGYSTGFGKIDMARIAEAYRHAKAASSDEYMRAVRVGRAAFMQRRIWGQPGFGKPPAQARRSRVSLRRWCLRLQLHGWGRDDASRSLALADHALAERLSVADAVGLARLSKRLQAEGVARQRVEAERALRVWQSTEGEATVREVKAAMPELASLPLQATPSPIGAHVCVQAPSHDDTFGAVAWAMHHAKQFGLASRLQKGWEMLHHPIMHSDCPPVPPAPDDTACLAAGMCICSEAGVLFQKRINKFINFMKQSIPHRSDKKTALVDGEARRSLDWAASQLRGARRARRWDPRPLVPHRFDVPGALRADLLAGSAHHGYAGVCIRREEDLDQGNSCVPQLARGPQAAGAHGDDLWALVPARRVY